MRNHRKDGTVPARAGVGLKAQHYREIIETRPDAGYFEVHAENYMGGGGPPHRYLTAIRERYPLSLHGVGLSIGSPILFSSVAHGSAHDIAGLGQADAGAMIEAISRLAKISETRPA